MNAMVRSAICIVGAGSTGMMAGYYLSQAGAAVTFLVRPHRLDKLSRPQSIFSHDDGSLAFYSGYAVITNPVELRETYFDFILVTLDAAALQSSSGSELVREIGSVCRGTRTAVVLGSLGVDTRTWFLEHSGLESDQVMNGALEAFAYEVPSVDASLDAEADSALLEHADLAFRHTSAYGFSVDQSAPLASSAFAALYDRNGMKRCRVVPADEYRTRVTTFPVLVAWGLLSWVPLRTINPQSEIWRLGVDAMREFLQLSLFGEIGRAISERSTASGVLDSFREREEASSPLSFSAFMRYQHGAKVSVQDRNALNDALIRGEAEGTEMPALRALTARLPSE
jgi:hypothetical protein